MTTAAAVDVTDGQLPPIYDIVLTVRVGAGEYMDQMHFERLVSTEPLSLVTVDRWLHETVLPRLEELKAIHV